MENEKLRNLSAEINVLKMAVTALIATHPERQKAAKLFQAFAEHTKSTLPDDWFDLELSPETTRDELERLDALFEYWQQVFQG